MQDCAERIKGRVQLTTDGHHSYLLAVDGAFSGDVDYAQLVKVYGSTSDSKTLKRLDGFTLFCFVLGIIFTILIAVTSLHSGVPMKDQTPKSQPSKDTLSKSLNGIQNLKPATGLISK